MRLRYKDIPDEKEFELLPAGKYVCFVEFAENTRTNDGIERINLTLKVESGQYEGQRIYDSLFATDKAIKRAKLVTKRLLGLPEDFDGEVLAEKFIGRRALVTTKTEVYDGKERAKVTFGGYEPIGSPPPPPDPDDDVPF